jgi:prophage DNA circulation protein
VHAIRSERVLKYGDRLAETMDYDQDSEEDVQEYLAEVCDSMKSST